VVKIAIFGLTHRLQHRITRKLLNRPIDRYTVADPRGGRTRRPPLIFGKEKKLKMYHLPIVKVDRKGLKVTLARLSRVFLDIGLLKRQLMAATCLNPSRTSSSLGHTMYRRRRT